MISNKKNDLICTICKKQYTKYTCPQCNIQYCSLDCYKRHSSLCVENFHRKQWNELLFNDGDVRHVTPEIRKETMKLLYKYHYHKNHNTYTPISELEERYNNDNTVITMVEDKDENNNNNNNNDNNNNDNNDNNNNDNNNNNNDNNNNNNDNNNNNNNNNIWDQISDSEFEHVMQCLCNENGEEGNNSNEIIIPSVIKKDFERALKDGRLSKWLTIWDPWWIPKSNDNNSNSNMNKIDNAIDQLIHSLPSLSKLTKTVSPVIPFYLIEILYAYAYMQRTFNGEVQYNTLQSVVDDADIVIDFVNMLITMCPNSLYLLNSNNSCSSAQMIYENMKHTVTSLIEMTQRPHIFHNILFSVSILEDVSSLLQSKSNILHCLFELQQIFLSVMEKSQFKNKRQLRQTERKIYFFMVWVNDQTEQYFHRLSQDVRQEFEEQNELYENMRQSSKVLESKLLISNKKKDAF
jgi:hypothetical protein